MTLLSCCLELYTPRDLADYIVARKIDPDTVLLRSRLVLSPLSVAESLERQRHRELRRRQRDATIAIDGTRALAAHAVRGNTEATI